MTRLDPALSLLSLLSLLCGLGCSSSSDTAAAGSAETSAPVTAEKRPATPGPTATTRPGPSADPRAFQIPRLPLGIKVPDGTTASTQPKEKTIVVDFTGHEVALVFAETVLDFAASKKKKAGEDVFERWTVENADSAVAEVEIKGAKEYYGFAVKQIGDKMYECGTLTRKSRTVRSEEAVKKALALCDGIVPR